LIVKTAAEAHRIPTVAENVEALEVAAESAQSTALSRTAAA
jgi:methylaspartate mutase epsilon subunit